MKVEAQQKKHKKRYSRISTEKRLRLIKLVLEDGLSLTKVSKLLHIKRPTAKVILKRFKESGTFFRKKSADAKSKDTIPSNNEIKVEENIKQEESIEINQYPSIENIANKGQPYVQDKYYNQTKPVSFVLLFSGLRQYHPFI